MKPTNRLREWRIEAGLSVDQVHERTGISRNYVYLHEGGGLKNPQLRIVVAYAQLYGKTNTEVYAELTKPKAEEPKAPTPTPPKQKRGKHAK